METKFKKIHTSIMLEHLVVRVNLGDAYRTIGVLVLLFNFGPFGSICFS